MSVSKCARTLVKCLCPTKIVENMRGKRLQQSKEPRLDIGFLQFKDAGRDEFQRYYAYLCSLPHVSSMDLKEYDKAC